MIAEVTVEPYGGKPTQVFHFADFTPRAEKEINILADKLGFTFEETVLKLIEDGLKENTVAQRIVEMIERSIDFYHEQYTDCWEKNKVDAAACYLQNKYTMETVLKMITEVINGA